MERLNFPIIRKDFSRSKAIKMDDYLRFVLFNLRYTVDITAGRCQKKVLCVNTQFSIK